MRSIIPKSARAADSDANGSDSSNRTRWDSSAARYDVLQRVGESTLFVTYRVRDKKDGRVVALKALKGSFARHELFASTLAQTMRAQIAFSHPNLAAIYEVGDEEATPFIVSQWLPGQSLESRLRRAPLGRYESQLILGQLLEGLAYLHERGLAHGDFRPRQVGADADGTLKITDAGLHRALAAAGMSQVDVFADAVYYQAPECADNAPASFSSDLYSLGVILYRMLAGRLPYDGPSPLSIALRHRRDAPMPPSQFNPDCAPQLEQIALKLLQKTPQTRYGSAREVLAALGDSDGNAAPNANLANAAAPVTVAPDSTVVVAAGAAATATVGAAAVGAGAIAANAAAGSIAPIGAASAATISAAGDAATQPLPAAAGDAATQPLPAAANAAASTRSAPDEDDEPKDDAMMSTDSDAYRALAKKQRRREAWGAVLAFFWFLVATGLLGGVFYGSYVYLQNDTPREVAVPSYFGKSEDEARRMLEKQDLTLVVTSQRYDPKKPAGTVLDGQPVPGHVVRIGREVNVTVSRGEEPTTMPDFSEMSLPRAREIIQKAGMKLGAIADQYHDTIPKGYICGQYPEPGQSVSRSEPLNLIVSRGSQQLEALQSQTDNVDNGPTNEDYLADPAAAATPGDVPMVSRVVQVRVTVPARGGNREVRIVVRDGNGENTVYQRTHAPGELVEEYIKVTRPQRGDKALIRVFLDDKLLQEQKV